MQWEQAHITHFLITRLRERWSNRDFIPGRSDHMKPYPNPTQGKTNIIYTISDLLHTRLTIYNSLGQQIDVLTDQFLVEGEYSATWDGTRFPAGIYYVRMTMGGKLFNKTLILKK